MRKIYFVIIMILMCACGYAETKIAPYYSLQLTDGITIPDKGDWMFSINIVNDIGLLYQPVKNHKILGLYEIKYTGPGLRKEEGEKFTDRLMDHIFVLRHHYTFFNSYTLKTQLDYMKEYKRTGTNEIWGQGLYDFNRTGGAVIIEKKFNSNFSASIGQQYHYLDFPNYTDLLSEMRSNQESQETSTGKQNHSLYQTDITINYGTSKITANYLSMNYQKQKVIVDSVQQDGSFYVSTLQKDTLISLGAQYQSILFNFIDFSPSISFKIKSSNQNYQHFTVATSTVPVQFIAQFYDYNQYSLSLPVSFRINSKWSFFYNPEWELKIYSNRPPRDDSNNFLTGTQNNSLYFFTTGFTLKANEVTNTTFFYNFQVQSSNMKFEKYIPYNYSGHYFGINFNYTY